jgi:hypothetical protein
MGLGQINTTNFLFADDDEKSTSQKESATSPDVKSYLQMNTTDDKFPILIRNNVHPGLVSSFAIGLWLKLMYARSYPPRPQPSIWHFRNLPVQTLSKMDGRRLLVTAILSIVSPKMCLTPNERVCRALSLPRAALNNPSRQWNPQAALVS